MIFDCREALLIRLVASMPLSFFAVLISIRIRSMCFAPQTMSASAALTIVSARYSGLAQTGYPHGKICEYFSHHLR